MHTILSSLALLCWLSSASALSPLACDRHLESRFHITPFNPKEQYVSNKGEHAFKLPAVTDSRGPCPGLNAAANNGWLPRSGNLTVLETAEGLTAAYGLGPDLGTSLGFLGVTFNGNGQTWTIGGWPDYIAGFNARQFKDLYDMGVLKGPNFQKTICRKYKAGKEGYDGNKNDPISSGFLGPFFDNFVFRNMGNKSAEYPQGALTRESLLPFFSRIRHGENGFKELKVQNRIPDNWYKRPLASLYDIPFLAADIVSIAALGGFSNPGGDNPLPELPISKLSKGTYTREDMKDPALKLCFLTQSVSYVMPALLTVSTVDLSTKATVLKGVRDFECGIRPLPCEKQMTGMDLKLVGELLGIAL